MVLQPRAELLALERWLDTRRCSEAYTDLEHRRIRVRKRPIVPAQLVFRAIVLPVKDLNKRKIDLATMMSGARIRILGVAGRPVLVEMLEEVAMVVDVDGSIR